MILPCEVLRELNRIELQNLSITTTCHCQALESAGVVSICERIHASETMHAPYTSIVFNMELVSLPLPILSLTS